MTNDQIEAELLPCPFCNRKPPADLSDSLYPSGLVWHDHDDGMRSYSHRDNTWSDNACYSMHCTVSEGGCGASISGDSREDTVAAWNRRPAPAQGALSDAEIETLWDAQRKYHGGEPCKVGHLEFARAILAKRAGNAT